MSLILSPSPDSYAPFYAGYVTRVAGQDLEAILREDAQSLPQWYRDLPVERLTYRYAPNKWSPLEVLGHINDTERIMAYRLLRIARGDKQPMPGMDQDWYVMAARDHELSLDQLLAEFDALRAATLALLPRIPEVAWKATGTASGAEVSAAALLCIIAGHVRHHLQVLQERY
ncbi:MAG: DinB family protein [Bacteroidetes bacterium]|nr:MAG: DinB family protein [Bacteroidota bacterium]